LVDTQRCPREEIARGDLVNFKRLRDYFDVTWSTLMSSLAKHIGSRAKAQRLRLNLSQSVVAGHLGITSSTLEKFETGSERIPARQLLLLAEIIEVSMEFFFREFRPSSDTSPSEDQAAQLLAAFRTIKNEEVRAYLVELSRVIAGSETGHGASPGLN
jgi:transcriptional regulator with XRE-family HTH domain